MSQYEHKVSFEDACAMLPDKEMVHTFRNPSFGLIGADWPKAVIVEALKKYGAELSGKVATSMKHGLVLKDESGFLFIETRDFPEEGMST